jgi:hypothetical protein
MFQAWSDFVGRIIRRAAALTYGTGTSTQTQLLPHSVTGMSICTARQNCNNLSGNGDDEVCFGMSGLLTFVHLGDLCYAPGHLIAIHNHLFSLKNQSQERAQ